VNVSETELTVIRASLFPLPLPYPSCIPRDGLYTPLQAFVEVEGL
jgi:hypothetical protein